MDKEKMAAIYDERSPMIFPEMLGSDNNYLHLVKKKSATEAALKTVIGEEAWQRYLELDNICNELECVRYKAMYMAGVSDHEKLTR